MAEKSLCYQFPWYSFSKPCLVCSSSFKYNKQAVVDGKAPNHPPSISVPFPIPFSISMFISLYFFLPFFFLIFHWLIFHWFFLLFILTIKNPDLYLKHSFNVCVFSKHLNLYINHKQSLCKIHNNWMVYIPVYLFVKKKIILTVSN